MFIKFNTPGTTQESSSSADTSFIGQIRYGMWSVNPEGWLFLNGDTIGNIGSSATQESTDYNSLYTLLWENIDDTYCPVIGGRGVDAVSDWTSLKPITLCDARGRSPVAVGQGSGLTDRVLGATLGEESHSLSTNENGAHTHTITSYSGYDGGANSVRQEYYSHNTITTQSSGLGTPHNTIHPVLVCTAIIKFK